MCQIRRLGDPVGGSVENPNLLLICLNAFVAVIGLLALLAAALRGLIEVFPEKPSVETGQGQGQGQGQIDAAVAVAITAVAHATMSGMRVTRIEEIRYR